MRALLLISATLQLTSCAFSNVNVMPPAYLKADAPPVGEGRMVQVPAFRDDRGERRCGMQKNSYNMDTANVICSEEPGRWLAEHLARRLREAGFSVTTSDVPVPGAVRVDGHLRKYFVEPAVGFWTVTPEADIDVELQCTSSSGLRAVRNFYVKGEASALFAVESKFQDASDRGSQQMVDRLFNAVVDLMKRYPELGRPVPSS